MLALLEAVFESADPVAASALFLLTSFINNEAFNKSLRSR